MGPFDWPFDRLPWRRCSGLHEKIEEEGIQEEKVSTSTSGS